MVCDGGEVAGVGRCGRLWGELGGEGEVLRAQVGEARFEGGGSRLEAFRVEVAGFEGGVVAVEGAFAAAGFLGERASLFFDGWFVGSLLLDGGFYRVVDDGVVAVERCELVDDGGFESVARDAFAVAAFGAELLSSGAGVVVVGAAVAFGAHADVGALAAAAAHKAGEQVVAGVAAAQCHVFAAVAELALRAAEGDFVDERFVQAGQAFPTPDDAAEVRLVLQYPLHDGGLPACGGCGCVLVCEHARDGGGSEQLARVEVEDALHGRCGALVRDDFFAFVALVAERQPPGRPLALPGAAFDPGGDAVDDRCVFELREHGQHLQHHPTRRRTRVERLGRRLQDDIECVEFLGQLRELAHLAREPVDAVDE